MDHQDKDQKMDSRRQQIVDIARSYVGTPYRHQGRTKLGMDCIGLCRAPFADLELETSDYSNYGENYYPQNDILRLMLQYCDRVKRKPLPGDILIMRSNDGLSRHMALYTENDTIIHAINNGPRAVVEHRYMEPFVGRTTAVLSWKGFID